MPSLSCWSASRCWVVCLELNHAPINHTRLYITVGYHLRPTKLGRHLWLKFENGLFCCDDDVDDTASWAARRPGGGLSSAHRNFGRSPIDRIRTRPTSERHAGVKEGSRRSLLDFERINRCLYDFIG